MTNFRRLQDVPFAGIDTHKWGSFGVILNDIGWNRTWHTLDPFARDCDLGPYHMTNDINPETSARYHMDADAFLQYLIEGGVVESGGYDLVIFDPPFSVHQADRKYGEGANIYAEPGRIDSMMSKIAQLMAPGGHLLKFGYNSTRHYESWTLRDLYLINFGGNRNDVIVSHWVNEQMRLDHF